MPINPDAIGATTAPQRFEWTERDTLLYALGGGAGTEDLAFTTENSHEITQQVLPTYAVICCGAWGAAGSVGDFNWAMLLHGSQQIRLHAPLPPAGKLNVSAEVVDIQDKGEGKNAILVFKGTGTDGNWYLRSQLPTQPDPCVVDPTLPECNPVDPDPGPPDIKVFRRDYHKYISSSSHCTTFSLESGEPCLLYPLLSCWASQ